MKTKYIIFVLILLINSSYSQIYNCNIEENKLKIYDFILENHNEIQKDTKSDLILVSIDIDDKSSFLQNIFFYEYSKEFMKEIENDEEIDKKYEIKVCNKLVNYISNLFEFCPKSNFENEHSEYSNIKFFVPLIRENILIAINEVNENLIQNNNIKYSDNINENTSFSLVINNIQINNESSVKFKKPILGKLNIYQSDIIKISENYFLFFKILKTSELNNNFGVFYFEYKLFYKKNGRSSLVCKGSHQPIYGKSVEIIDENSIFASDDESENKKKLIQEIDINFEVKFD